MDNLEGNVSTIAVAAYAVLAPYISQYVSQDLFLAVIGLIIVLWSAYNPNTFAFFGNGETSVDEYSDGLNQEYTAEGEDDEC